MAKRALHPAITIVKKGRRLYGGIYVLPSGERVYLAYRRTCEIFRSGKSSISEACRDGTACWAIDYETLLEMRRQKIRYIGVEERDTRTRYLSTLECFMDSRCSRTMNYTGRGGALQRYLPLSFFRARAMS